MVYFIQSIDGGPVKIGSSNNPTKRLEELKIGSPVPLRIIGEIAGDEKREKQLHEKFKDCRLHGEWFSLNEVFKAFLDTYCHISPIKNSWSPLDMFVNEHAVAKILSKGLQSLRNDRHLSRGLPYYKFGKSVRYKLSDITTFVEAYRVIPMG